jgi:hypothetical protein
MPPYTKIIVENTGRIAALPGKAGAVYPKTLWMKEL